MTVVNAPIQELTRAGASLVAGAVTGFSSSVALTFDPGPRQFLVVKNTGGADTMTVVAPGLCSDGVEHDLACAITASKTTLWGPFPAAQYADPATGLATATFVTGTNLTIAAVHLAEDA